MRGVGQARQLHQNELMLPAYIIEQLREREQSRKEADRPRPLLELPLGPPPGLQRNPDPTEDERADRGVTIIDIF